MFINHNYKFIFIHVPKVAGTSIRSCFKINSYDKGVVNKRYPHSRCSEIKEYCGEKVWDEYFKFAFVRNPFDRSISFYHFHKSPQYTDKAGRERALSMEFKDWVDTNRNPNVTHTQSYYLDLDIDYVGRYENLQNDFNIICDKLDTERFTLPHYNSSQHSHWLDYYDKELMQRVHNMYKDDFNKFNYVHGL